MGAIHLRAALPGVGVRHVHALDDAAERTLAHASAWAQWLATSALVVALGTYLALAIRRIFAASWSVSIAKGVSILLLGIPINLVMFDTAIVLTLLTT